MKRLLLGISLLGAVAVLAGCPIYPSNQEVQVCDAAACYSCPDSNLSNACTPWPCQSDGDCPGGYTCDGTSNSCVAGSSGYDGGSNEASTGTDCSYTGCPSGQVCKLSNGSAQCVTLGGGDDGSTGGGDASVDSGTSPESGTTPEASTGDASEAGAVTGPCNSDGACGGNGERCVDGQCTIKGNLCSDGSQCVAAGSACVDGLCEARCSASSPCPTGYQCDLTRGVCNLGGGACAGSGTSTCQGGTTCVDAFCVPPCAVVDAGSGCPSGQACVNGGCVPDQAATFACTNDGQSGSLANSCNGTDVCIHHDCYPACSLDGGTTCPVSAGNTSCKNVTIETGTYAVCGTTTTLGSQCDASQGNLCSGGKVCVDGYCL